LLFLILAIVFNTLIGLVFRYFKDWKIELFPAIVVNYWVCVLIGILYYREGLFHSDILEASWWPFAWGIGAIFIIGFNFVGAAIRFFGVTFTTIMQKISLVLTALVGWWFFNESMSLSKALGILLAAFAVWLLNYGPSDKGELNKNRLPWYIWLLPAAVLLVNAGIDSIFLTMNKMGVYSGEDLRVVTYMFAIAAILGSLRLVFLLGRNATTFSSRELKAGLLLGGVNYFSIHFVLAALHTGWEGSIFYPILNTSILSCTALAAYFLFKEQLSIPKWIGFGLVILSIFLISS
jgi:drug/metabolite transporter (DMT)-like permease